MPGIMVAVVVPEPQRRAVVANLLAITFSLVGMERASVGVSLSW